MKASEYIAAMQKLIDEHGDLDVEHESPFMGRISANPPVLGWRLILKGRESKPRLWSPYCEMSRDDAEVRKGEKVIAV